MNFVTHQDEIKQKCFGNKSFSGCYVYSRDRDDKTYKIGMSEASLYRRLVSAKSCYPYSNEFYLHFLIVTADNGRVKIGEQRSRTRELERILLINSKDKTTQGLEKKKDGFVKKSDKQEQGNRGKEYRFLGTKEELQGLLHKTLLLTPIWSQLVVFQGKGWSIHNDLKKMATLRSKVDKSNPMPTLEKDINKPELDQVYKPPSSPRKVGRKRKQTEFYADNMCENLFKKDIDTWKKENRLY